MGGRAPKIAKNWRKSTFQRVKKLNGGTVVALGVKAESRRVLSLRHNALTMRFLIKDQLGMCHRPPWPNKDPAATS